MSDLPKGWIECESKSKPGVKYYYNTVTKASLWEKPTSNTYRASHLLVKHSQSRNPKSWRQPKITRSIDEARSIIDGYRQQIVIGQVNFEQLASTESDCSSASRGGDLGVFRSGEMQISFEEATARLSIGELSEPVYSDSGIHLILRTG
eukprot:TRINITY_DN1299_c0_g1_i1.p1 TRINITY_DN1299_c0_g1~~TRINITY_DN1299_c0_g1_i1.p1  ORF type:complete len:149 (-),score=72.09 TRINITY_DN1299_c0_g1_i1:127-573(-)